MNIPLQLSLHVRYFHATCDILAFSEPAVFARFESLNRPGISELEPDFLIIKPELHLPVLPNDYNQILPDNTQSLWKFIDCPGIPY
jgi:hypothetical protein